jgi:predicted 3-demethylubiquinone-9 3-methyltransferase (glyoxalase superfamily)
MQKMSTCLWFNDQAEEAVNFYTSIFQDSEKGNITRYGEAGPGPAGTVLTVTFKLNGQEFIALNGGPQFSFSPAISLVVNCDTQDEIDMYWEKLAEGGETQQCGWLVDKFGISWQIVPVSLDAMMTDPNLAKSNRVMEAVLRMDKLVIDELKQAYEGGS